MEECYNKFLVCRAVCNELSFNLKKNKKHTEGKEGGTKKKLYREWKKQDTHLLLMRRTLQAQFVRTENEAPGSMVRLNKKIYFVNNRLFELFKRDMEWQAIDEVVSPQDEGMEGPKLINEEESKAKLLVACRLTRAYNILLQKGGKLCPLLLKKIFLKNLKNNNNRNPDGLSREFGDAVVRHNLRICVKALYVAARMKRARSQRRRRGDSVAHFFADELGLLRQLRLTERLAADLVSKYQNDHWQPKEVDEAPEQRPQQLQSVPSTSGCYRHRTFPCSYSSELRGLAAAFTRCVPGEHSEEGMTSATNEIPNELARELDGSDDYTSNAKNEVTEDDLEEFMYDSENKFKIIEQRNDESGNTIDGTVGLIGGDLNETGPGNIIDYSNGEGRAEGTEEADLLRLNEAENEQVIEGNLDFPSQAENIRIGDIFWASAPYEPPFEGAAMFDKRGRPRDIVGTSCVVVVFAALRHAYHPCVLAVDRYFEKYPCLRENAGLLTVCPEGGVLDLALLMVQRTSSGCYPRHRGGLASSLVLRCRPRQLPCCVALDMACRVSSCDALSDLRALGPEHSLVKWSARPPLLPTSVLLGYAELGMDDLVGCHLRPAWISRDHTLPAWRHVLTSHAVFQPTPPPLNSQ